MAVTNVNVDASPVRLEEDGQYLNPDLVDIIGPFEGWEGSQEQFEHNVRPKRVA